MIKVIFYYETHHYFLPSFQTDVLTNIHLSDKFFQSFYSIFTSLGWHDYVFDLITEKINLPDSRIVTDKELSKSFQSFSFKSLNAFLEKLDPMFIDEKLDQNPLMRKHLYYLIFLNYKLFKNILFMEWWILELEELIGEDIDDNLKTELSFSRERITHVEKTNIQVFNKYKIMLEKLINLMLKK